MKNSRSFPKCISVSKTLGRLNVQTFTTDVSNHLINFPLSPKTVEQFTLFVQNNKIIYINNNNLAPALTR